MIRQYRFPVIGLLVATLVPAFLLGQAQKGVAKPGKRYELKDLERVGDYGFKAPLTGEVYWIHTGLLYDVEKAEQNALKTLENIEYINKYQRVGRTAIEFLGQIRSVKAVPILCKRLLWSPTRFLP